MTSGADYLDRLQQLLETTEQVQVATEAQNWDAVLAGLARRQELMDQIDAMPDSVRQLKPQEVRQATGLLSQVSRIDEQATTKLESALQETRASLQAGGQVRTTISAYQRANRSGIPQMDARFIDRNR